MSKLKVFALLFLAGVVASCGQASISTSKSNANSASSTNGTDLNAPLKIDQSQVINLVEPGGSRIQQQITATYGPVIFTPAGSATSTAVNAPTNAPANPTTQPTNTPPTSGPTASATQPLPTLKTDLLGIQTYANVEESRWMYLVDRAQFMGVRWIKFQISWKEIEPTKGQFTQVFDTLRKNMIYAGRRHFKMMASIVNAPDWARPAEARGKADGPPANPQDLANFVGAIMDNYGGEYLNAVEIWNEPNVQNQWTGAPLTAESYDKYFTPAYKAIRQRSQSVIVLSAGPAPAGNTAGSVDDRQWLQALYTAGLPISDPNFAIGAHPYGWANPPDTVCCVSPSKGWDNQPSFFFLNTLNDYRAIMVKNNHAQGKIWATEFGWPSFENLHFKDHVKGPGAVPPTDPSLRWMSILNQEQQAQFTLRAFVLAQSGDLASFMGPMVLWNLNFATLAGYVNDGQPALPEAGFSVLDSDLNARRLYYLLQDTPKK